MDIQARGFSLTAALRSAAEREVRAFAAQFPQHSPEVRMRLFDVNGRRGGLDKGCLVSAHLGRGRTVVASDLDTDLYQAIVSAFTKLLRGTRSALNRELQRRRDTRGHARLTPNGEL